MSEYIKDINVEGSIDWTKLERVKVDSMYDIRLPKQHELDMSKVKTLDDVIKVIKALDITVSENYKHFDEIKDYLK
jgi:hypothetical protein